MRSHIINNKSYTKQFRQAALAFPVTVANIIFIEKRSSCSSSLSRGGLPPLLDLSGRNCNVFLTKMDALLPVTDYVSSLTELSLTTKSTREKLWLLKLLKLLLKLCEDFTN